MARRYISRWLLWHSLYACIWSNNCLPPVGPSRVYWFIDFGLPGACSSQIPILLMPLSWAVLKRVSEFVRARHVTPVISALAGHSAMCMVTVSTFCSEIWIYMFSNHATFIRSVTRNTCCILWGQVSCLLNCVIEQRLEELRCLVWVVLSFSQTT